MFISKLEKDMVNDRIDELDGVVDHLLEVTDKQEKRIADLEAVIGTLTDLFSAEINARVGKKCAELTTTLTEKLGNALKELDNTFGKIVKENKKKTTKTEPNKETKVEPKKTGRPKKETK